MKNNEVLRSLRYIFNFSDAKMGSIFALAGHRVTRSQVSEWLRRDDDPAMKCCKDIELAIFLNGLIIEKRGKKEGPSPEPEHRLTNNSIFKKLRIALDLKGNDIQEIMELARFSISEHEITAFFRKPGQNNYRLCKDQVLRNFIRGLQLKYRPKSTEAET
nr:DUF1456 family protein [uncultured Desulfobulbus sp.]